MSDASADVIRKAKKLPWWLWLVALGALIIGYLIYRHYENTSPASTSSGLSSLPIQSSAGGSGGAEGATDSGSTPVSPYPSFSNESEYDDAAISEFGGQSGMSPLQIQSALDAYNSGSPLTKAQDAIIDAVTKALGQSPDFPGTLSFAKTPTAKVPKPSTTVDTSKAKTPAKRDTETKKKAPAKRDTETKKAAPKSVTVTVKRGDTLTAIARAEHVSVSSLYDENKHVIGSNPNLIHPGQKLVIKK